MKKNHKFYDHWRNIEKKKVKLFMKITLFVNYIILDLENKEISFILSN